jgi:hypothetical protein
MFVYLRQLNRSNRWGLQKDIIAVFFLQIPFSRMLYCSIAQALLPLLVPKKEIRISAAGGWILGSAALQSLVRTK